MPTKNSMTSIWHQRDGEKFISLLNDTAWRIVESQEVTATRKLVDSLDEQIILEDLIEGNKPGLSRTSQRYHPLLYTPFRYPPLKYGSRFGKKTESALWYGALHPETTMAEKAFYQFNFLRASKVNYNIVQIPLTLFSARVKTDYGIKLTEFPFAQYVNSISSPFSYDESQLLGAAMRDAGVQAFIYSSARDSRHQPNIALFTPKAFLHSYPEEKSFQSWQCTMHHDVAEFTRYSVMRNEAITFSAQQFFVNGILPFPAN